MKLKLGKLQKQWVKALESGKYKQGKNALAYKGKYCCLGVLCEMLGKLSEEDEQGYKYIRRTDEESSLTVSIKRNLGFIEIDGQFKEGMDTKGWSKTDKNIYSQGSLEVSIVHWY